MGSRVKGKILSVRISAPLERRLRTSAKARGVTPSDVVRGLLEAELGGSTASGPSLYEKAKALIGSLDDRELPSGRNTRTELNTWRPDRRG